MILLLVMEDVHAVESSSSTWNVWIELMFCPSGN
jgi:hypothetical protein